MSNYQITPKIESLLQKLESGKLKLMSKGSTNAKTEKNNLETFIMYMSPFSQNSKNINICPKAKNCISLCLNSAGRGAFNSVQVARQARTEFYIKDRNKFAISLHNQIKSIYDKAIREGKKIAIRLNGTSDLDFIAILKNRLNIDVLELYSTTIESDKPGLIFYDYTKILGKIEKYKGSNYTLTFSYDSNQDDAKRALRLGVNVAVVFRSKDLPAKFMGTTVIDGDKTDIEMLQYSSKILGLSAKGRAKKDATGFVVN
jgi:hypothetical protein